MTKADIVNEISRKTGIDKSTVLTTVEAFMDTVKECISPRIRKLYSEETCAENCKKHLQKHYNHY